MRGTRLLLPLLLALFVMALLPALASAAPESSEAKLSGGWRGLATHYYPGAMERVVRVRARQGYTVQPARENYREYGGVFGYVAVPNCALIGKVITACVNGRCERVQVMDCSQTWDWWRHTLGGKRAWVEFSFKSAKALGVSSVGRFPVTVYGLYYSR